MGQRKKVAGNGLSLDPSKEPAGMSTAETAIWRMNRVRVVILEVQRDPNRPLTKGGKPRAPKTVAMKIVAKQLGISPMGLRQCFIRHAKVVAQEGEALERYPIDTLGVLPDAQAMADVAELIELVEIAAGHMGSALSTIRQINARHLPLAHGLLEPMYDEVKSTKARLLDRLKPVSVCPYCKGLDGHSDSCEECSSTGVANGRQLSDAPHELRDDFKVVVHTHGVEAPVPARLLKKRGTEQEIDVDDLWA